MIHTSSRSRDAAAAAAGCWRVITEWTARKYARETSAYLCPVTDDGRDTAPPRKTFLSGV